MKLDIDSWIEFRLGDLFAEMYKAEAHVKGDLECFNAPTDKTIRFISRTEMNNGCDCYVLNNEITGIEEGNAIAIGDTTATCFTKVIDLSAEITWLFVVLTGLIYTPLYFLYQY